MKKLNVLVILTISNFVYCMEAERKSLASFFGMPEYHQDISQQIAKYYAAQHQWWYIKKDLEHEGQVKSAYFNKAGTEIITAAYLGSIRDDEFYIWDSNKGIELAKKEVKIPIEKALFNEDATDIIVITKNEGYDALYHTRENENNIKDPRRMFIGEHFFSCSKSGREIISPHNNLKAIGIHDNKHGLRMVFNNIDQNNFAHACLNKDETEIIGMSQQGVAYIWNVKTQKCLLRCNHENFIGRSACFNHQGTQFLVYGASPILYVHARERGKLLKELKHPKNIYYACFNHQDTEIFTVASDGYIRVWNCNTGCMLAKFGSDCETLDCHKEGNRIVTPIGDCARMWVRYDDVTLPQILLIKLLNVWWRLKKPDKAIDSSKKLLSTIATILRWDELCKTWQSLPEKIKDDIWLFMIDKIQRYGK
ncbi:MAG TPA: hypothetical protein VKU36_02175 [Candidatus Babeliales bacterium]|nr:hypothetical protein [Candidatus Babeliales bacterium]